MKQIFIRHSYGLNCLPHDSYVEVLTPVPKNVSSNSSSMRSLAQAIIQDNYCPYKERRLASRHTQRKDDVKIKGEKEPCTRMSSQEKRSH